MRTYYDSKIYNMILHILKMYLYSENLYYMYIYIVYD